MTVPSLDPARSYLDPASPTSRRRTARLRPPPRPASSCLAAPLLFNAGEAIGLLLPCTPSSIRPPRRRTPLTTAPYAHQPRSPQSHPARRAVARARSRAEPHPPCCSSPLCLHLPWPAPPQPPLLPPPPASRSTPRQTPCSAYPAAGLDHGLAGARSGHRAPAPPLCAIVHRREVA
nr:TANK-binding kinase 1-binding protein 1-like [Aegilops tauschii subsp. strangulata]